MCQEPVPVPSLLRYRGRDGIFSWIRKAMLPTPILMQRSSRSAHRAYRQATTFYSLLLSSSLYPSPVVARCNRDYAVHPATTTLFLAVTHYRTPTDGLFLIRGIFTSLDDYKPSVSVRCYQKTVSSDVLYHKVSRLHKPESLCSANKQAETGISPCFLL